MILRNILNLLKTAALQHDYQKEIYFNCGVNAQNRILYYAAHRYDNH
jgi:hypothetical protein